MAARFRGGVDAERKRKDEEAIRYDDLIVDVVVGATICRGHRG